MGDPLTAEEQEEKEQLLEEVSLLMNNWNLDQSTSLVYFSNLLIVSGFFNMDEARLQYIH